MNLDSFIVKLALGIAELETYQRSALAEVGRIVEDTSKENLGTYQAATAETAAWAPLSQATQDDRVAKGFTANDPLLRSGELQRSIEHEVVSSREVHIGSDRPEAEYLELGTIEMPPRSFLLSAVVQKSDEIAEIIGEGFLKALKV